MTDALKQLITQEAENNYYSFSWDFIQGRISGGLYWVEKMEGFAEWCVIEEQQRRIFYIADWKQWRVGQEFITTSQLLEIYFEQLKKKEI